MAATLGRWSGAQVGSHATIPQLSCFTVPRQCGSQCRELRHSLDLGTQQHAPTLAPPQPSSQRAQKRFQLTSSPQSHVQAHQVQPMAGQRALSSSPVRPVPSSLRTVVASCLTGLRLARHLVKNRSDVIRGARILELGSGTGVVGITCAALGGHVILTDQESILQGTFDNVQANQSVIDEAGGSAQVSQRLLRPIPFAAVPHGAIIVDPSAHFNATLRGSVNQSHARTRPAFMSAGAHVYVCVCVSGCTV